MLNTGKLVFKDRNTGTALYEAELPDGFVAEALYTPVQYQWNDSISIRGSAIRDADSVRLFFRTGESFHYPGSQQDIPSGSRNEEGSICHEPCNPDAQIREFATCFLGRGASLEKLYFLPEQKRKKEEARAQEKARKIFQIANQVTGMQAVSLALQAEQVISDGGTGVFRAKTKAGEKILLVSLWRAGLQFSAVVQNAAMFGMLAMMQPPRRMWLWEVPLVVYLMTDPEQYEAALPLFYRFLDTLEETSALREFRERLEAQNLQRSLQEASMRAQQTQMQINYAWQQQQQAWNRVSAISRQISDDLDSFHQGIHQQAAAFDEAHGLDSASLHGGYGADLAFGGESPDDRIQRLRHESIMGVDTYDREDGTTVEHTTMDDRLFENNLTPTQHFGTEHYYDDYVPDGWTELFRKK